MTAKKQLNIRSDEAYVLATTMAKRENLPTQEVVVRALRAYVEAANKRRDGMTAEQEAQFNELMALGRRFRSKWKYGELSDHSDMYDEDGLPV
jgi:hypothetical protein